MLTRWELENLLGTKLTDAEWKENLKIFSQLADEEWERTHPLDD